MYYLNRRCVRIHDIVYWSDGTRAVCEELGGGRRGEEGGEWRDGGRQRGCEGCMRDFVVHFDGE